MSRARVGIHEVLSSHRFLELGASPFGVEVIRKSLKVSSTARSSYSHLMVLFTAASLFFGITIHSATSFATEVNLGLPENTPHIVYGAVQAIDGSMPAESNLSVATLMVKNNLTKVEIESFPMPGWGYSTLSGQGLFWLELSALNKPWTIGETLRLMVDDKVLDESAFIDLTLDGLGAQQIDLQLQSGDNIPPITYEAKVEGLYNLVIEQGTESIDISAIADDFATGNSIIIAAEVYADSDPGEGAALVLSASDCYFDSSIEMISGELDTRTWMAGEVHSIVMRGQDAGGNWGLLGVATVNVTGSDDDDDSDDDDEEDDDDDEGDDDEGDDDKYDCSDSDDNDDDKSEDDD